MISPDPAEYYRGAQPKNTAGYGAKEPKIRSKGRPDQEDYREKTAPVMDEHSRSMTGPHLFRKMRGRAADQSGDEPSPSGVCRGRGRMEQFTSSPCLCR